MREAYGQFLPSVDAGLGGTWQQAGAQRFGTIVFDDQVTDWYFSGYSIGQWTGQDSEGRFTVLEFETRGPFKGRRAYDATGLPLHFDNQSIFKEKMYLDKADPNVLHDEITVIDNALTRPWSVKKSYTRLPSVMWTENNCTEDLNDVFLGNEQYMISADGHLMPIKKDQAPPDLRQSAMISAF